MSVCVSVSVCPIACNHQLHPNGQRFSLLSYNRFYKSFLVASKYQRTYKLNDWFKSYSDCNEKKLVFCLYFSECIITSDYKNIP